MMKIASFAGGAALALGLLATSAALAQNSTASDALSTSKYGALKCAEFVALSPKARDAIVRHMVAAAPARSLATPMVEPKYDSDLEERPQGNPQVPGTPLSAGQLISACQARPASSLREAYAASDSGTIPVPGY